jgi:hypothetical protein
MTTRDIGELMRQMRQRQRLHGPVVPEPRPTSRARRAVSLLLVAIAAAAAIAAAVLWWTRLADSRPRRPGELSPDERRQLDQRRIDEF